MKLTDIPVYYINPDSYKDRKQNINNILLSYGFNFTRVSSNDTAPARWTRINNGFLKLLDKVQTYPALILEDDATPISTLPLYINIVEEASIIYLGASTYECGMNKKPLRIEEYNSQYYRLFNSLGAHAMIIPNKKGADFFRSVLEYSNQVNYFSDYHLALKSEETLYLTPKDGPYFYQNDGHNEYITKFLWSNLAAKNKGKQHSAGAS